MSCCRLPRDLGRRFFIGDGTQICVSLCFICSKLGAYFVHYGPRSAQLNEDHKKILEEDRKLSGGPGTIVKP